MIIENKYFRNIQIKRRYCNKFIQNILFEVLNNNKINNKNEISHLKSFDGNCKS